MIKIAPSILSADFAHLARDIAAISTADYVHVDVMDGLFVPNISIGIPAGRILQLLMDFPETPESKINAWAQSVKALL